ncbi:hypothetical protein [Chryseobacterium sp. MFBS3-17]|uniref:hypothetical protein n=1 Tax=Chryseobacterium sp. MFBS3-17 TaxID=2886689 RepID=UPI001D0E0F70|nr:hypothetical protein [Chryseobacterium sp. MFBS3-17]MCC2590360.1 hypothetical protein [Chryseobacterium sp. MFBS3-17]
MAKVTQEQIDAWKKQHGSVFAIKVEGKIAYLRTPDRKTLSYASAVASKDPLQFNELILEKAWLGGDEELRTNDSLFLSVCGRLAEIIEIKEATLEKL